MVHVKQIATLAVTGCLMAGAALMLGCASDKPSKPATAAAPAPKPVSLGQIKSELLEAKTQIQATTDSLVKLRQSSQADAQANYNAFSEQYMKLQTKADSVKARANDLKAKTQAYYATWNKQIEVENPDLRRQAVQQKTDAERVYNSINSEMQLARIAFNPYMSNLKDVGNYLHGNLSPASLTSIGDLATKASGQAKEVNTHIDSIVSSVDKMSAATGESATARPPDAGAAAAPAAGTAK